MLIAGKAQNYQHLHRLRRIVFLKGIVNVAMFDDCRPKMAEDFREHKWQANDFENRSKVTLKTDLRFL